MSKKSKDKLNESPLKERAAYFAAGRATVGTISQVEGDKLVRSYVGKVRGVIVSNGQDMYMFKTPDEARACARWFISHSKKVSSAK